MHCLVKRAKQQQKRKLKKRQNQTRHTDITVTLKVDDAALHIGQLAFNTIWKEGGQPHADVTCF